MTHGTEIAIPAPRRHAWKDAAVIAFLVIVLGAFVAQLLKAPAPGEASDPTAAAQACLDARC